MCLNARNLISILHDKRVVVTIVTLSRPKHYNTHYHVTPNPVSVAASNLVNQTLFWLSEKSSIQGVLTPEKYFMKKLYRVICIKGLTPQTPPERVSVSHY